MVLLCLLPSVLRGEEPRARALEVVAPSFFPTWQAFDVCYPFVFRDATGDYLMYYTGTGADQLSQAVTDQWATGLLRSKDLRTWSGPEDYLPVLAPHPFLEGELSEAARLSEFDAMAAFGVSVLQDGPLYRMWYTGWNGDDRRGSDGVFERVSHKIGLATSTDGTTWAKHRGNAGMGAVLANGPGSEDALAVGQPWVIRDGAGYVMWYEGYDGSTWRILSAVSADGVEWRKRGIALDRGPNGSLDDQGARNPVVIQRLGRFELWYQGWANGASHVLRATSVDGLTWTRLAGEVGLHTQPGRRTGEQLHVDSVLAEPDGSLLVFFAKQTVGLLPPKFGGVRRFSFRIYSERIRP